MRAASSAVSADSTSESATRPHGSASTTSTAAPCSNDTGPEPPSTLMCVRSEKKSDTLTSSTAATPANPSPSPAFAKAKTTHGISGRSSLALLAYYDPESSCWRTSQATLDLDSMPSSLTLPAWGMTHGGELFELPMSVPLTSEHGCSSSQRLATPKARDGGPTREDFSPNLAEQVKLLPSPQSSESTPTDEFIDEMIASGIQPDERLYMPGRKWHTQRTLSRIAPTVLPTPTGDDANNVTRESGEYQSLTRTVHLLPTPTREADSGGYNPAWGHGVTLADAARIVSTGTAVPTGVSMPPPSPSGNTSSDDQPHDQLTIEDA